MPEIKRMLVPTDFSASSDIAFAYALDMAAREGSRIQLLHCIDEAGFATAYPDGFYVERPGDREQIIKDATARLKVLVERCAARQVTADPIVLMGRPARTIADTAAASGSDLIVMGTHGRTGFAHLVLGSVAEQVLRAAPCAVLTVRDTARVADALAADAAPRREPSTVAAAMPLTSDKVSGSAS